MHGSLLVSNGGSMLRAALETTNLSTVTNFMKIVSLSIFAIYRMKYTLYFNFNKLIKDEKKV